MNRNFERMRIFGTETEYGINPGFWKNSWLSNGGLLYEDCNHLEYASPETSNPLDAVIYDKAGDIILNSTGFKPIYKNNVDSMGNTFGAHENYFIKTNSIANLREIIPFLATRQIFTGSGQLMKNGTFLTSQRSMKITSELIFNSNAVRFKSMINEKKESHSDLPNWYRLHLILGDANMCEVADFLKIGTTSLVLDLLEDKFIDFYNTDSSTAKNEKPHYLSVLHNLAYDANAKFVPFGFAQTNNTNAIEIQEKYYNTAKLHYGGRDEITDLILNKWDEVLNKLSKEPDELFGVVDWITKKKLITDYATENNLPMTNYRLRNIDLQYHDINKKTGIFYNLQNQGLTERICTDKEIENAAKNPPKDTRAYIRGNIVNNYGGEEYLLAIRWDQIKISKNDPLHHIHEILYNFGIGNPFDNYSKKLKEIEVEING